MGVDWKKLLGGIAPTIATALGVGTGPVGAAVAIASRALFGRADASADDIAAAIAAGASPEQVAKLQEAEREFSSKLVDAAIKLEEIEAADRSNARAREIATKDWTPRVLALSIFLAFFVLLAMMLSQSIPAANERPFDILLGMLGTGVATVLSYYFGSSSSSRAKDVVLGRIAAK